MVNTNQSPRDLYILGMLSRRKTYGHELIKAIRVSRADMWVSLSEKHVYYVLRKLANLDWITESELRRGNTPPRKVYEITPAGRRALADMLRAPALREAFAPSPFDAVLGMLGYTDVLEPDEALQVLHARREVLRNRLHQEHPEALADSIEQLYGFIARSIFDKSRALLSTELAWIDEVIARISSSSFENLRVPRDFLDREEQ